MATIYRQYTRHGVVIAALTRLDMGQYAPEQIWRYNLGPFAYEIHRVSFGLVEGSWNECQFLNGQPCYSTEGNARLQRRIWKTKKARLLKKLILGGRW